MLIRKVLFNAITLAAIGSVQLSPLAAQAADKDVVTTAIEAGSFKTLVTAVQAAGLVETLQGKGPFTVFAPTDDAFSKLPAGTVESLLKPENKSQLVSVLTYHVVPGQVSSEQVVKLSAAVTANGQRVDITVRDDKVMFDQATVTTADIHCSNGVIHVIDQVLLPSADTIPATAEKAGQFKTLLAAAKAAGLVDVLAGNNPLTVFAPTDDAFAKLPAGTIESLLKPENKDKLASILKFHVVPGRVFSNDVLSKKELKSVQGGTLTAAMKNDTATIEGATLIATDIDTTNGVIHIIDKVMLPSTTPPNSAHVAPVTQHTVSYTCPQSGRIVYHRVRASHRR